ncbi:hypothetical protein LUX39_08020 [Actinomadura madurae]|nr:acyl-CoA dehydrogenase family protein [Actinomadura madurae]MCQ0013743.1 hypothetical protein [Actinomadura madurae]
MSISVAGALQRGEAADVAAGVVKHLGTVTEGDLTEHAAGLLGNSASPGCARPPNVPCSPAPVTRCAVAPTRSCAGSSPADWDCDDHIDHCGHRLRPAPGRHLRRLAARPEGAGSVGEPGPRTVGHAERERPDAADRHERCGGDLVGSRGAAPRRGTGGGAGAARRERPSRPVALGTRRSRRCRRRRAGYGRPRPSTRPAGLAGCRGRLRRQRGRPLAGRGPLVRGRCPGRHGHRRSRSRSGRAAPRRRPGRSRRAERGAGRGAGPSRVPAAGCPGQGGSVDRRAGAGGRAVDLPHLTAPPVRPPIAKFQAVQQLVADAACESALARAATDAAVAALVRGTDTLDELELRIAIARSVTGHAISVVVRNAHQVHGAIGTTLEHPLHEVTLPALAWRAEFGSLDHWDQRLTDLLIGAGGRAWQLGVPCVSSAHPARAPGHRHRRATGAGRRAADARTASKVTA